jgi:membrane associated rhomboid family serine protease
MASEPVFNVPRPVVLAAIVMIAVQLVRSLLPDGIDVTVLLSLALMPARYSGMAVELPGGYLTAVTSFVTYMVVHGSWIHLVVNVLWMLAFGTAIARRIGAHGFWEFSILCGVAGAITHLVFHWGEMAPVVGASAAISGQMAGALRFIFFARRAPGEQMPDFVKAPLANLGTALRDHRIMGFLIFWVVLNAYFGLTSVSFGGGSDGIAWEAHIGGFVCGLLTFGFFDRAPVSNSVSQLR